MSATTLAGVDGCRAGWIAVIERPDGHLGVAVFPAFAELAAALPDDTVIAVDMPIGLPDHCGHGGRGPEGMVRPLLGARQSSVFSIPSRQAVCAAAPDGADWPAAHRHASGIARATSTPARGVSIQAFGLFARIRELDTCLRADPGLAARTFEAHPELAFWRLNGRRPLVLPKKVRNAVHEPGMAERRALLVADGFAPAFAAAHPPRGAGADDLLDAVAVLTTARRIARGEAESFPARPALDAHGLRIAIHV